jgi:hypothetical protein
MNENGMAVGDTIITLSNAHKYGACDGEKGDGQKNRGPPRAHDTLTD